MTGDAENPERPSPSSFWQALELAPRRTVIGLIRAYQLLLSPLLGPVCRFAPSCSSYGVEAVRIHGVIRGGWLTVRRVSRCHPWNPGGWDPVPPLHSVPPPNDTMTADPAAGVPTPTTAR